jgi:UPF0271 protein
MKSVDLNCDVGEGVSTDEQIIPLISSANIACGLHAGSESTMKRTIELCIQHDVAVGAHPSWPDRKNFGRTEMQMSEKELYDCVTGQLYTIQNIAASLGSTIHHVKPHGALYNQSAKDKMIADTIAKAVKDADASLIVFGLSGSISVSAATALGLKAAHEVFADRTYMDDGSLTPRSHLNALITDTNKAVAQALQMILHGTVQTGSGKIISIRSDTVCLHGDGTHAVAFATGINNALKQKNIDIKTI